MSVILIGSGQALKGLGGRLIARGVSAPVPTPTPVPTPAATGNTLTVGPGKQYTTIAAAIAAAQDGDTVQVQAGTYTNDFASIAKKITVAGVNGMAHLVATVPPPNGKAIFTTSADVTLDHLEFSGAAIGGADHNAAGVRHENGKLTITACYFHDNENGLLAGANLASSVYISNSEFAHNGEGTGSTHNIYIGDIATFVFDASYSHDAVVGHEIKSRAENTTITNSRIFDGPNGTASYSINLPNGGNALIQGNVIQQGPATQNPYVITFGEEGSVHANSVLSVVGNTIINDMHDHQPCALWNSTSYAATATGNSFWGFAADQVSQGAWTVSGSVFLSAEPGLDTTSLGATSTPTPTSPVVLPARTRYAREVANAWGVNAPFDGSVPSATIATAMSYLGTRWARMQFAGGYSTMTDLQAAFTAAGMGNLKLQVLLNTYMQNASINTWAMQQQWLLSLLATTGPSGTSILRAVEGGNELNNEAEGGGSHNPGDMVNHTGHVPLNQDNPPANAMFVAWAQALHDFRVAHPELAGVEILSPTMVYFLGANFSSALNVTGLVDYGTFHDYGTADTGTAGVPSQAGNPGSLVATYGYAQAGICPGVSMVLSEFGCSTQAGTGGYSETGAARYHVAAFLDFMRLGGHRAMAYTLFNNPASTQSNVTTSGEDNYGLFWPDLTPKASAIVRRNLQDLLSLKNNADDPANLTDTQAFTPAFDGSTLTVSGVTPAGGAGCSLVLPKSDGSTMIAVWGEPQNDTGGNPITPPANPVTVDLGKSYAWKVYDVSGSGGGATFNATRTTSPIATGTGQTVLLTLHGVPLMVQVL